MSKDRRAASRLTPPVQPPPACASMPVYPSCHEVQAQAAQTFESRVHEAESQGAKILYNPGRQGSLLPPITPDHVPHESALVMRETFEPIVPIVRVPDDDQAVMDISNSTPFGLSSGVCTNNLHRAIAFIEGLDVGTVNISELGSDNALTSGVCSSLKISGICGRFFMH